MAAFHLSLPVRSVEEEVAFFVGRLRARVTHRDPGGYVNVDWFGAQITLQPGEVASCDFHFGVNLDRADFEELARELGQTAKVVDAGTSIERRKFYVRSPSGYLVELKTSEAGD
ncbi:MAG TPA: hypothetical protein VGF48_06005 [Thermoanaerobaculia bacterium]|jgi:extradiol dioxygenase family protein